MLPPSSEKAALVQPQQNLASKDNPQWIESPEDTRQRLREEADANADNPELCFAAGQIERQWPQADDGREQTQAYREARKIQMGAYADKRRFLSDPPLEYRKLPEEATADLGEPEQVKDAPPQEGSRDQG